jgi:hypothetical protein
VSSILLDVGLENLSELIILGLGLRLGSLHYGWTGFDIDSVELVQVLLSWLCDLGSVR